MAQHTSTFTRLNLPPIPDLWQGMRVSEGAPPPRSTPASTTVPAFPRPTLGRGATAV